MSKTRKQRGEFDKLAQSFADRLTPEQAVRLIQIADPLTDEERARFDAMSDDDLLAALCKEGPQ